MNNKRFLHLFWRKSLPLVIIYLFLIGLLALLLTLYRVPGVILFDFIRFSLPLLVIWFILDYYRLKKRVKAVSHKQLISPENPVEATLLYHSQTGKVQQQKLVSQLHKHQQQQLEQIELYSHEIKN